MTNRGIRRIGTAVIVLFLALVGQLTYLQMVRAKSLKNDPRNVRTQIREYARPRGQIITADGKAAARSVPSHDEFKFQREYPLGELVAQIVGYQSFVYQNAGVEDTYNDALTGKDIRLSRIRNVGDVADLLDDAKTTGNVVLTVDSRIQDVARTALGSQKGAVVVLDTQTGGVVAMYANPTIDLAPLAGHDTEKVQEYFSLLQLNPEKPSRSRAYAEIYPPGSTFKVVTTAVALDLGVATPDTDFPVLRELKLPLSTSVLKNFGNRQCGGTLAQSFQQSCNTTFGQLGLNLGNPFVPGMQKFGIGEAPPLDLKNPGAASSTVLAPNSFKENAPFFALAGIGQGDISVTPLQMALVAEAVARGGEILEPHVGAEVQDRDGTTVRTVEPKPWKTAMTKQTADELTGLMLSVVNSGTGTAARIPGVEVAGKTGTAQQEGGSPHAWFIAFAPANAPRYAVSVLVERGGSAGDEATGGRVAAPIARRVLEALLTQ